MNSLAYVTLNHIFLMHGSLLKKQSQWCWRCRVCLCKCIPLPSIETGGNVSPGVLLLTWLPGSSAFVQEDK